MSQTHKFKEFLISSASGQKQNTQQCGHRQVPRLPLVWREPGERMMRAETDGE